MKPNNSCLVSNIFIGSLHCLSVKFETKQLISSPVPEDGAAQQFVLVFPTTYRLLLALLVNKEGGRVNEKFTFQERKAFYNVFKLLA